MLKSIEIAAKPPILRGFSIPRLQQDKWSFSTLLWRGSRLRVSFSQSLPEIRLSLFQPQLKNLLGLEQFLLDQPLVGHEHAETRGGHAKVLDARGIVTWTSVRIVKCATMMVTCEERERKGVGECVSGCGAAEVKIIWKSKKTQLLTVF